MNRIIRKIKLSKIINLSTDPEIKMINDIITIIKQLRMVKTEDLGVFHYVIGNWVFGTKVYVMQNINTRELIFDRNTFMGLYFEMELFLCLLNTHLKSQAEHISIDYNMLYSKNMEYRARINLFR